MPLKTQAIRERIDVTSEVLKLERETDKKHIFEILRFIHKRKALHFTDLKADKSGMRINNNYLSAYMKWLKHNNFIQDKGKLKSLTDKGEKALLDLDNFFHAAEPIFKFNFDFFASQQVSVSINEKTANLSKELTYKSKKKVTQPQKQNQALKNGIFTTPLIQRKIIELSAALTTLGEQITLTINIPPMQKEKLAPLKLMWNFYWQKSDDKYPPKKYPNPVGPLLISLEEEGVINYTNYWKEHLTSLQLLETLIPTYSSNDNGEFIKMTPPFLPNELDGLKGFFMQNETRKWIESKLEKDADWFMPHQIWVRLGFKQLRDDLSVNSLNHVSPPTFHEIKSHKLPAPYGEFDKMITYAIDQNNNEGIRSLCYWITMDSKWKKSDFYESWRILRQERETEIGGNFNISKLAKILNQALIEYITSGHKPGVDIACVLNDYLQGKDYESLISELKSRCYLLDT